MARESELVVPRDHACGIGTALLMFNQMESELAALLVAIGGDTGDPTEMEALRFEDKRKFLAAAAEAEIDETLSARLLGLLAEAVRLNNYRTELAHGLVWWDPIDRCLMRRFVRFPRKSESSGLVIQHEESSADGILAIADALYTLGINMAVTATELRVLRKKHPMPPDLPSLDSK